MVRALVLSLFLLALPLDARSQAAGSAHAAESAQATPCPQTDQVEFEKMTWVEVRCAIAAVNTTALIYTGGFEARGPQYASGGYNVIAHATVEANARKLGSGNLLPRL